MAVVDVAEIHALHGRRVSGTRANIDRFVMGPAGVFVIDAKRYEGQIHTMVSTMSSGPPVVCCVPLAFWVRPLTARGTAVARREGDASLFAFEKTSTLVTTGLR